jgi:hypothetical protein
MMTDDADPRSPMLPHLRAGFWLVVLVVAPTLLTMTLLSRRRRLHRHGRLAKSQIRTRINFCHAHRWRLRFDHLLDPLEQAVSALHRENRLH